MTRRKRADSAAGELEIIGDALDGPPNAPSCVKITRNIKPFWDYVTDAKAKRAWQESDLILAADVARAMWRLELISKKLEKYYVIDDDDDIGIIKEFEKIADTLSKRVRFLSSHLQIHPEATQGKSGKQKEQNKKHQEGKDIRENPDSLDDLIPGVNPQ